MIEYLVIAVLVIWSALVVFKKVFPKTASASFTTLSASCEKQGWHSLAKWLKPKMAAGCAGGCGCSADEKPQAKNNEVKPVKWH